MADYELLKFIHDNHIQEVTFRFTDFLGQFREMNYDSSTVDLKTLTEGIPVDGSSLKGWKEINDSDITVRPDLTTAGLDPFASVPTLILICDIIDPGTGNAYNRDPRGIAKKSVEYAKSTGIADTVRVGAEPEFFALDGAEYRVNPYEGFFKLTSSETSTEVSHHLEAKGGYLATPPRDMGGEMRSFMMEKLKSMGVSVEKHHHETAPDQHEIGIKFDTLVRNADDVQRLKYCAKRAAHCFGKTVTFMPKPISGENGSGMHVHLSLKHEGKHVFAGDLYAGLSKECLYFIGGVQKHMKALNAFTNPSTNSYKRLVPGFEAPVLVAYSRHNRSAGTRIPLAATPEGKRPEFRFPDSAACPYLAYAAILMAGIDGIQNQIDPGEAIDTNLYALTSEETREIPHVCTSLSEALDNLDQDRAFLTAGGVFNDDLITSYIKLKRDEIKWLETMPTPGEFQKYYSV
ncbi:type I glutamate--ammonia ligase [Rhizobium leguminosarum]|uniref:type I glutamate--ammonia ligase n=1 Tax=Rhizobium leguminosarum TaxID=384 RepID=UPI001AE8937B|nr:type I glutamate--ammonia ligase [Rhizobium leguminosarum]MBP2449740.1 glutamine synthetase [Rhizobium leguminosarum]